MELCAISIALSEREVKCHCLRLAWDDYTTILRHEKQFAYESFMCLAELLEPDLAQNNRKSVNSCGQLAICPQHILGLTILWLSSGSYQEIFLHPHSSAYKKKGCMKFYAANICNLNYLMQRKSWMHWLKDSSVRPHRASWPDASGHWMDFYYLFVPLHGKKLVMFDSSLVVTIKGWGLMYKAWWIVIYVFSMLVFLRVVGVMTIRLIKSHKL
jgi:hypothetical protein